MLEAHSPGHDSNSDRVGRSIDIPVAESGGGEDWLLLAIDRVARYSSQSVAEVDDRRRDNVHADDPESPSFIDELPAVALAEWRWGM